jgi:CRP/FNR family cyclic AMP-dependent transcriptional regulator
MNKMSVPTLARPLPSMPGSLAEHGEFKDFFKVETYPNGSIIYRPGDSADRVFLLRAGRVRLLRPGPNANEPNAQESVHALLRPGDLFGEIMRPPDATMEELAVTQGETELWSIVGDDLRGLVEARPPLALEIVRGLNERVRSLRRRVNALTFKEVPARLAESLLSLGETHGERCPHGGEIDLRGITQQDLADLVGASRSFVSTLINEMKRDGMLGNVGRVLCIKNQRELRRLAVKDRV